MAINWTTIFKKYKGLWVALAEDERTVVGSGKRARAALKAAEGRGVRSSILMKMPPRIVSYVGGVAV